MLQTQFIKESMNYFFVVERKDKWNDSYEENLFKVCDVPYFMQYEMREINGMAALYYKMSYRTTLKQAFECVSFTPDRIDNIIRSIIGVLESCEDYLVIPDNILFDSEYVFFDIDTGKLRFCYYFGKEDGKSLNDLTMEILQHVDKRHESGAVRLLKFYNLLTEPDCTVEKLKNFNKGMTTEMPLYTIDDVKDISDGDESLNINNIEPSNKKAGMTTIILRVLKTVMLTTAVIDIVLLAGLILNILTYEKMGYLFIGMAFLIGLVIIYMHFETDEESPDEIMEEYRKSVEKNIDKNEVNNTLKSDVYDPATVLLCGEQEIQSPGVTEKYHGRIFLEAMEKERYSSIHIGSQSIVLGSMQGSCDFVLTARGISRLHAKLLDKNDGVYIMDMNSTNGTYINGEMLQAGREYKIEEGDLIAFAGVQYYALQEG